MSELIYSKIELASVLDCDLNEIDKLIKEDSLPHIIVGGRKLLFLKSSIAAWLKQKELPVRGVKVVVKSEPKLKLAMG
jgi:predicted DNA-binding transcriptional regulator AlpA